MTDEVWEYIFCNGPWPSGASLPKEKADVMKRSFDYFYPMDIRSSGKDLIPNHLTFAIYVHAAIFPEDKWPLSMRTNGHLMVNGQKMSKSKGNSMTMRQCIEKFGADATRLCQKRGRSATPSRKAERWVLLTSSRRRSDRTSSDGNSA